MDGITRAAKLVDEAVVLFGQGVGVGWRPRFREAEGPDSGLQQLQHVLSIVTECAREDRRVRDKHANAGGLS